MYQSLVQNFLAQYRLIQCLLAALLICSHAALPTQDADAAAKSSEKPPGQSAQVLPPAVLDYLAELETARQQAAGRDSDRELPQYWQQLARDSAEDWGLSEAEAIEKTRNLYNKKAGLVRSSARGAGGSNVITVGADIGGTCDFLATNGNDGLQQALDAANLGANAGVNNEIRVANTGDYSGRRYFINDAFQGDQSITIVGGYEFCSSPEPSQITVLDANGTSGPVIQIEGNVERENVVLENLRIRNGSNPTGNGGGLSIDNNNFVILRNTIITDNTAADGGGISITGLPSGETLLWLLDGSSVSNNTADARGGGLYCNGADAVALDTITLVAFNAANNGGGIYVDAGCSAVSYSFLGILSNEAVVDGGGVYAVGMDSAFTLNGGVNPVFGFGDASVASTIRTNTAGRHGGGIFAGNPSATGTNEQINVFDGWIVGNVAGADESISAIGSGGGIYLRDNASLRMDRRLAGDDCHNPVFCSRISENEARRGAAVRVLGGDAASSELIDIRQTWITENINTEFPQIINISGDSDSGIELLMEGNVIAENQVQNGGSLRTIRLNDVDSATIAFTTITDNNVFPFDAAIEASGQGDLRVYSSILHEDFGSVFDATFGSGLTGQADCLLLREIGTLPPQSTQIFTGDPNFDGTTAYGLGRNSAAIDICDTGLYTPQETDILGEPRGFDVTLIADELGPYDLGANERSTQLEPLQVFATSVTGSGDLSTWADANGASGIDAGDQICQARASAANLPEPANFVAWLSDSNDDAYCRINGLTGERDSNCGQAQLPVNAGPWLRTDGQPFAESIALALAPENISFLPPRFDEFGNEFFGVGTSSSVRTGTTGGGSAGSLNCSDWSSTNGSGKVGDTNSVGTVWSDAAGGSCNSERRLLCMERGPGPELPPFGVDGKLIFASSASGTGDLASWSPADPGSSGIEAGDSICRNLATDAGLPNPLAFKAWLSDSNNAAPARIFSNGPWVRPDGVPVAASAAELTSSFRTTGIAVTELGRYLGNNRVWTGTDDDGSPERDHCNNWQDSSGSFDGMNGIAQDSANRWSGFSPFSCSFNFLRLYCIEDVGPDVLFLDGFEQ